MNIGILDLETSMKPILHPWMEGSYLSTVGLQVYLDEGTQEYHQWTYYHDEVSDNELDQLDIVYWIQHWMDKLDLLVGHNLKFDLNWIKHINVDVSKLQLWDTCMVDYMLNGQEKIGYSLDACCFRRGIPFKTDMVKTYWDAGVDTCDIPLRILLPYMKNDIMITAELFKQQYVESKKNPKFHTLVGVRNQALHIMTELELNGMGDFDQELAQENVDKFKLELEDSNRELRSFFGRDDINVDSGQELSACLFGGILKRSEDLPLVYTRNVTIKEPYQFTYKSGKNKGTTITKTKNRVLRELTCKKRVNEYDVTIPGAGFEPAANSTCKRDGVPTGYFKTNKGVLANLTCSNSGTLPIKSKRRVLELLKHRSKISKFTSTFEGSKDDTGLFHIVGLNSDNRVHPNYNQSIAATGRLTSSNPNGQNFPRSKEDEDGFTNPLKAVFKATRPDGLILVIDLSQLEWRVAAWLSQDQVAMDEIINGVDCHLDNAIKFFGDAKYRQDAKIMTFRLLYGGGAYAFWIDPKMPSFSKGRWNEIVDSYCMKYRGITEWQDRNISLVPQQGGKLYSPTGRIYQIPQEEHKKYKGTMIYKDTCIKNYMVQGTATGDIVPLAMNMIQEKIDLDPTSFMSSNWMGQVHDSVIFDTIPSEVKRLAFTGISVFEELPERISKMWGVDFNLPMTGEAEWGPTYADLHTSVKHEEGKWILKTK